jgi:glycolate oxidase
MTDLLAQLRKVVGDPFALSGAQVHTDYTHDEALTARPVAPGVVVLPADTAEVADILRTASLLRVPVVIRGSGTGLSGGCLPVADGILIAFDRMRAIKEIDPENQVAVVEPGVTLEELDKALAPWGLAYPVSPGEAGASLGGNVATNAGGMRAVRYGVTRHHVLGLEVVLADGTVMRTGGKFVKSSSGYDLTQLLIGSEGTLAVTTEITLKVHPRPVESATILAPFATLAEVAQAVPQIVSSGVDPSILEYIDVLAMAAITASAGLDLGIPDEIKAAALAYLVVVLDGMHPARVEEDAVALGALLSTLGALDVYLLPRGAGSALIEARERAFFVSKAAGADDIVDAVLPRAAIPAYLARVADLAAGSDALVSACGHVGDGNVHLSVFQPDEDRRHALLVEIYATAIAAGGAVSGEHGIGTEKLSYFLDTVDAVNLDLMRAIKAVFDPLGILAPGRLLGEDKVTA